MHNRPTINYLKVGQFHFQKFTVNILLHIIYYWSQCCSLQYVVTLQETKSKSYNIRVLQFYSQLIDNKGLNY